MERTALAALPRGAGELAKARDLARQSRATMHSTAEPWNEAETIGSLTVAARLMIGRGSFHETILPFGCTMMKAIIHRLAIRATWAILALMWVSPLWAQLAGQHALPPLMYVRFEAPKDMVVTLYPGQGQSRSLKTPFTVGLRPGYIYRIKITNIPERPLMVLHPTLEVRASLWMANHGRNSDHPAGIVFTKDDFQRANGDGILTKVVLLEHPDRAEPIATKPFDPIQIDLPAEKLVFAEAKRRGRPMVVLRMGQRDYTDPELLAAGIPGTILLPGEKTLGVPAAPPVFHWGCYIPFNPAIGKPSAKETTLIDGGDRWPHVAHDQFGDLRGFDPSDTIAEYSDSLGQRKIAVSNRVKLCIPRYLVLSSETILARKRNHIAVGATQSAHGGSVFATPIKVALTERKQEMNIFLGKQRASSAVQQVGLLVVGRVRGVDLKMNTTEVGDVTGRTRKKEKMRPPDRPLKIIKWPDECDGKIGEIVTFYIRVTNVGGQPIDDIAISDSLTTRLEYVSGSAKSNRQTVFTTQANNAGSAVLRWEFTTPLLPQQSGLVSFQARIR